MNLVTGLCMLTIVTLEVSFMIRGCTTEKYDNFLDRINVPMENIISVTFFTLAITFLVVGTLLFKTLK